jgi:peroxiredoxin (alkyl hydroperoxide reductase subunit C)
MTMTDHDPNDPIGAELLLRAPHPRDLPSPLRLGDPAPAYTALGTTGEVSLSDSVGQWVVLFSYEGDFLPVSSTEVLAFAERAKEFAARGVQIVGVGFDGVASHIAWIRSLEETFKITITFPLLTDSEGTIAQAYGMLRTVGPYGTHARSLFVLDPGQTVRAILHYPSSVGWSVEEILRLVDALQLFTERGVSAPACWKPGDPYLAPVPETCGAAETLMAKGLHTLWYLPLSPKK